MTTQPNHDEYAAASQGDPMKIQPYLKAAGSFAAAFAAALYMATKDRTDLGSLKATDWVFIAVGAAVTAAATFFIPYATTVKPPAG
jgi:hypothetical protein